MQQSSTDMIQLKQPPLTCAEAASPSTLPSVAISHALRWPRVIYSTGPWVNITFCIFTCLQGNKSELDPQIFLFLICNHKEEINFKSQPHIVGPLTISNVKIEQC